MKKKLLLVISVLFMFPVIANADIKFPKYINGNTKLEGLDTLDNGDVVYYQWRKEYSIEYIRDETKNLQNQIESNNKTISSNTTNINSYTREKNIKKEAQQTVDIKKQAVEATIAEYKDMQFNVNGQICDACRSVTFEEDKNNLESKLNNINEEKGRLETSERDNPNTQYKIQSAENIISAIRDLINKYDYYSDAMSDSDKLYTDEQPLSIKDLETEITKLTNDNTTLRTSNDNYKNEITRLKNINNPDDSKWVKVGYNNEISSSNLNDNSTLYIKVVKSDGSSSIVSTNYNYDASTGQYKNVNNTEDNTGKKQIKLDKITLSINSTFDLASLLEDTSIIYSSNNAEVATISSNGLITGLKAGTAIITAEGTGKIYTIDVEVKGSKIEDSTGNSSIIYNGDALDDGTQENYNKINENDNLYKEIEKKVTGAKRFEVIEITLTKDGQNVQPKSKVTVEIKIPSGYNPDNILVYYVEEDGTLTLVNHIVVGDKVQIDTDKVGKFVIVEKEDQNKNESSNNTTENPKTGTIISISVIIVGIIVATGIYFYTKKKNKLFRL